MQMQIDWGKHYYYWQQGSGPTSGIYGAVANVLELFGIYIVFLETLHINFLIFCILGVPVWLGSQYIVGRIGERTGIWKGATSRAQNMNNDEFLKLCRKVDEMSEYLKAGERK